jgi:hypothetical protein
VRLVDADVLKLHGDLPLHARLATVARLQCGTDTDTDAAALSSDIDKGGESQRRATVLFCTDVGAWRCLVRRTRH